MSKHLTGVASNYRVIDTDLVMTTGAGVRQYVTKFRDLPEADKPRERLIENGPTGLSLQELLAVVLNTGTKKEDVQEMSQRIVREYGKSALADQTDPQKLSNDLDIPIGKATQIVACAEIGRRLFQKNESGLAVIRTAADLYDYVKDMHTLPKEQLRGIYLDTHNRVIHNEVISIGTINSNIVHPREVFKPAILCNAAAIILSHNHPSGDPNPSAEDRRVTQRLREAGQLLGIEVLDHVIVGEKDRFVSLKERGVI